MGNAEWENKMGNYFFWRFNVYNAGIDIYKR